MWFKQLSLFRLNPDALPDLGALEAGMEQHGFAPPGGLEWSSQGFVAPASLPNTLLLPGSAMTDWLAGDVPDGFELDCDAVMRSPGDDGATVRCSRQDLTAREVQKHIETGKVVTQLGLVWRQRIRFVLTDRLELKRLQFLDVLEEQASQAGDDAPALFDATATLMLGELRQLVADLIAALGGEAEK